MLTRDQILSTQLKHEEVKLPEWGGSVLVWELSAAERDALEVEGIITDDLGQQVQNTKNVRARLVSKAVKDENGKPVFTAHDVEELGQKSGKIIDRLFWVARRLSSYSRADIEELEKNSQSGQPA